VLQLYYTLFLASCGYSYQVYGGNPFQTGGSSLVFRHHQLISLQGRSVVGEF